MAGRYIGAPPPVLLLDDGRGIELIADFAYVDAAGTEWAVPKKAVADGASIPRAFWTLIGGPLEGRYRNASIVHDYYCEKKKRTWQATHHVFYEAMRTSGVSTAKAKTMFLAVWWGGPRWEAAGLGLVAGAAVAVASPGDEAALHDDAAAVAAIEKIIADKNPSLDSLEALAEHKDPLKALRAAA